MQLTPHGPAISHLFFANDVLLFTKAKTFWSLSGLKVRKEKSHVYISKGVPRPMKHRISHASGFRITNRITRYLGFRMFHGQTYKTEFESILDRVSGKLSFGKEGS